VTLSAEERWFRLSMERSYVHALIEGARLDGAGPAQINDPDLCEITGVIAALQRDGKPSDVAMILGALRQKGAAASGKDWGLILSDVITAPAVPSNAPEYASYISAVAALEKVRTITSEVNEEIDRPGGRSDPAATLAAVLEKLDRARAHAQSTRPLEPLSADDILAAAARPLEWTIEPLLTVKGVRILSGLGKTGKSTLAIALALTAIKGRELAGHFKSDGGHSFAILDAENRAEVWARKYVAIARGFGLDPGDLIRRGRLLYVNRRSLLLDDGATLHAVIELLRKASVSEIVIDSLTGIHRKDENDAGEMRGFFQQSVCRLRDEVCAGVTVLHHHRKPPLGADNPSQAIRGSSDLRNVCDTHLALSRDAKDQSVLRVDVTAQREAEEAGPFYIRTVWTDDGRLTFEPVAPGDAALPKVEAASADVLALLQGASGGAMSRRGILDVMGRKDYSPRTTSEALSRLSAGPGASLDKDQEGREVIYRMRT
jgi:hypothetical protein